MSYFGRRLVVLLTFMLLSACGTEENGDSPRERQSRPMPIEVVDVAPRELVREISLSGRVRPRVMVRVAARTSGAVDEVTADEGDWVNQGEVLVRLDMSEAQAELARAEAEAETARLDYQRVSELREREVATATEYQNARAALQVAESTTLLWRTRVDYGEIRAPRDAVVTRRHLEPGEAIQNQDVLFELAAMDELIVRVGVPERDIVHLNVGDLLPMRLDALPDSVFQTRIRHIAPMPESGSQLTPVEFALPADAVDEGVRPGFLARIQGSVDRRTGVLAVPSGAVGMSRGERYLMVVDEDRLERRVVETGVTRGGWTEIISGLQEGEVVLATNPLEMRDGQSIRIVGRRGEQ